MASHTPLAYYQVSPVRGQLEPYDGVTRTGWRYLQCTDTPNELKVLLPPKTATLYSQLLQYESTELAKGKRASWDRILQIRHLKDRMIRKCQRISRLATPAVASGASAAFRIVHAPPDFRLKEMERWIRDQEPRGRTRESTRTYPAEASAPRAQTPCSVCGHVHRSTQEHVYSHPPQSPSPRTSRITHSTNRSSMSQRAPTKTSASLKRRVSASSQSTSRSQSSSGSQRMPSRSAPAAQAAFLSPVVEERTGEMYSPMSNPYGLTPEHDAAPRESVVSPEPLPHPYRSSSSISALPMEMPQPEIPVELPVPAPEMPMPVPEQYPPVFLEDPPQPMPVVPGSELSSVPPTIPLKDDFAVDHPGMPEPPVAGPSTTLARPGIPRRRSSLKQSGRVSNGERSTKVVSWAMDNDWSNHMSKFDHIAYATEIAGNALDEARTKFQTEIQGVQELRYNLTAALEKLRLETEKLQMDEQTLRAREERLRETFDHLAEKEINYKETVAAVLEETKRVVIAADRKRDEMLS